MEGGGDVDDGMTKEARNDHPSFKKDRLRVYLIAAQGHTLKDQPRRITPFINRHHQEGRRKGRARVVRRDITPSWETQQTNRKKLSKKKIYCGFSALNRADDCGYSTSTLELTTFPQASLTIQDIGRVVRNSSFFTFDFKITSRSICRKNPNTQPD